MIKLQFVFLVAMSSVMLFGCTAEGTIQPPSNNSEPVTTSAPPLLPTKSFRSTPIEATPTIRPSISTECLPSPIAMSQPIGQNIIFIDTATARPKLFSEENLSLPRNTESFAVTSYSVSPDYRKLAYFESLNPSLSVSNLVILEPGMDPVIISDNGNWIGVASWLDDDHILLEKEAEVQDGYALTPVPLVVLDYKTGASYELVPDFLGIDSVNSFIPGWKNFSFSKAKYSPLLEYVVYPKMSPYEALVLWDLKAGHQITNLTGFEFYGVEPKWSPDGQSFVVAKYPVHSTAYLQDFKTKQELFRITTGGVVEQLTHITDFYTVVQIDQFSWSPDGKYIAFWLLAPEIEYANSSQIPSDRLPRLAILDLGSLAVTNYCIAGGWFGTTDLGDPFFNFPDAPIWSPDSARLAVQSATDGGGAVVVIDIREKIAYQITDAGYPIGWLTSE